MAALNAITLLLNGLTLSLSLSFLVIVLWNDARKELNQFFAAFLLLVLVWNAGSLIFQAVLLLEPNSIFSAAALGLMELGFTGASVAVYALTAVLVKAHTKRFRALAFASLLVIIAYRLLLIVNGAPTLVWSLDVERFNYQSQPMAGIFYVVFDGATLYLLWRYRRKIRSRGLTLGLFLFVIGQSVGFLNPELQTFTLSLNISAVAALLISFAILREEIIRPLVERNSQVEALRNVSLAITSQADIEVVLDQIATQAAGLLSADAAGIFLRQQGELELATVYNLPDSDIHTRLASGVGVAGTVARTRQSMLIDDYARDWRGAPDLPLAKATFGSVIGTPLIYGSAVIGVLMVIAARHGRLFSKDDVYLLELLGAQASVAITHSRLFSEQQELNRQVETARSQLETLLSSIESPVIAVDRQFRLIFANPAVKALFSVWMLDDQMSIYPLLPPEVLPKDFKTVLRDIRHNRTHVYEIALDNRVFLCHLASLGRPRVRGWVAVMNDVTQLKELDRLKSEMVRMTSHDLKNPLQAAMANVELLRDDLGMDLSGETHESLETIDKQLARMNRIISGILDLERLKSGKLAVTTCYPEQIVENAVDELRYLALDQQVQVETNTRAGLPTFSGDAEQMERAIINLVENAIKFTPKGGRVCVGAYQDNNSIVFEVEDSGVGIAGELQPRIFDRFFRANQRGTEHVSGSGLGLSLVKAVVENHRGKLWLNSEVGVGTTFYVAIPLHMR